MVFSATMSVKIRPIRLQDAAGHNACVDVVARERRYLGAIEAPLEPLAG